jgi:cell division protein FtsW
MVIRVFISCFCFIRFLASSNLAFYHGTGNTRLFGKTFSISVLGFNYLFVHRVPYHYFRAISKVALPVV